MQNSIVFRNNRESDAIKLQKSGSALMLYYYSGSISPINSLAVGTGNGFPYSGSAVITGSLSQGNQTIASGSYSHAEGLKLYNDVEYNTFVSTSLVTYFQYDEGDFSVISSTTTEFVISGDGSGNTFPFSCSYFYIEGNGGEVLLNSNYYSLPVITNIVYNGGNNTTTFTFSPQLEDIYYGVNTLGGVNQALGQGSHTEGIGNTALGLGSHAEGINTQTIGIGSHSEGISTISSGSYSHAEGNNTIASGSYSHAEGNNTKAIGGSSHAEGSNTQAIGNYSHAEGITTQAIGTYSHAEGITTQAIGTYSHAEGNLTTASGVGSHAEGYNTKATSSFSHTEGYKVIASGYASHAEGMSTQTETVGSHAEGIRNIVSSGSGGSFGTTLFSYRDPTTQTSQIDLYYYHSNNGINNVVPNGDYTSYFYPGDKVIVYFDSAYNNTTLETIDKSNALWFEVESTQYYPVQSGSAIRFRNYSTLVSGSFGVNFNIFKTGGFGYAPVYNISRPITSSATVFPKEWSIASLGSHAEGFNTTILAPFSTTHGDSTIASGSFQMVVGRYNTQNNTSSLFVIGNGSNRGRSDLALFNSQSIVFSSSLELTNTLTGTSGIFSNGITVTGSINITGSLNIDSSGSFVLPLTSSNSPQTGSAYWSGSFLFIYDGTQYRSASFA